MIMSKRRVLATIALAVCAIMVGSYYAAPAPAARTLIALNRMSASLAKSPPVSVGPHQVHYLDGGKGETVVLLHGIFAEKDHWVDFARPLTKHYRIIAPDLPGFGESSRLADQSYNYAEQVDRLAQFLDALNIKRAHIAGNSMGGTIASLFAIRYPDRVLSVGLIGAPHGIRTPIASEMDQIIEANRPSPLIARTPEDFDQLLAMVFKNEPFLPYPIRQRAKTLAIDNAASNERLWREQKTDRFLLDSQIDRLTHPTLVLWGDADRSFHVSGADVLKRRLANADVRVLKDVGHLPMMETPSASASAYRAFISQQSSAPTTVNSPAANPK
jgi:abhydrolase domain-containing protein 6